MVVMFDLCALNRRKVLSIVGYVTLVGVGCFLGGLLAYFLSPCNPRNVGRCGRRLVSTLQVLDAGHLTASEDASALCPSLTEAVDCFYWFSQRCLPVREQHFYSKVYVDTSAVIQGLCRPDGGPVPGAGAGVADTPLLTTHGPCLRTARAQRSECNDRFVEDLDSADSADDQNDGEGARRQQRVREGDDDDGGLAVLIDSLFDPEGAFQMPLCRALREYILCGLRLVSRSCGLNVALRVQDLHDNLTSLVFKSKCDADMKPVLAGPTVPLKTVDLGPSKPWTLTCTVLLLLLTVLAILVRKMSLSHE